MTIPLHISMLALRGFPFVQEGDGLGGLILESIKANSLTLEPDDVVVVAQKVVSKAEGRAVRLDSVQPCAKALEVAEQSGKDARMIQLIIETSSELLRVAPGVVIAAHRDGWVMANAGIDQSNVEGNASHEWALLLPADPDASAQRLRTELGEASGIDVGVIINDTFGRPWREGVTGVALGVAGWPSLIDRRGARDLFGCTMMNTVIAHADELAAAASLLQGQAAEGRPVVIIRGVERQHPNGSGRELLRTPERDLFR